MTLFSIPIGPHDVPFAAPLMAAAMLAFTMAFIILKLLDRIIDPAAHSSQTRDAQNQKVDRNKRQTQSEHLTD